jgi:hypothetical protein
VREVPECLSEKIRDSGTTAEFSALLAETGLTLLGSMRDLDDPKDCHEYYYFRKSPTKVWPV